MKENIKLAKKLFQTAENDLKAVEVLYNAKNYSIALFQLQQSVEKFVKSYGIRMEIIEPKDLTRKVSHLPHKVFKIQYSSQAKKLTEQEKTPLLIPNMVPPHQRGRNQTKEKIEQLEKSRDKINKINVSKLKEITKKDLTQFIIETKEFDKEHQFDEENLFNEFKDDFIKTHEHFKEYFKEFNDDFLINDVKKRLEYTDEYVKHNIRNYKFKFRQDEKINYITYVWLNLSLITAPHEQSTRYPSISTEETPNEYYTNENIVIEFIPEFIKIMKKTVSKFNEVYK